MILENLKTISSGNTFAEKILIVPSFTIGHQILESLARKSQDFSWINFKVKTIHSLADEVCEEEIYKKDLKKISFLETSFMIDEIFSELAAKGSLNYFEKLLINTGIISAISSALAELKFAGIKSDELAEGYFINKNKAHDIKLIYAKYEENLKSRKLADSADIINMAIAKLKSAPAANKVTDNPGPAISNAKEKNQGPIYIAFSKYEYKKIEKDFMRLLCGGALIVIDTEEIIGFERPQNRIAPSAGFNSGPNAPYKKLSYLFKPEILISGDLAGIDDTVSLEIFCAKNHRDEIYRILNSIVERKITADDTEILYTNPEPYLDIIYNLCKKAAIPVTFGAGLAGDKSVAGKALKGFLLWIGSDFEEIYLRNLIKYRLIKSGKKHADILRQLKIGWGENRYSRAFAKRISFLKEEIEKTSGEPSKNSFFKETLDATLELESIVSRLFKIVPQVKNQMVDMPALCSCCISFLADFVSMPNKEVDYAKQFSYITELKKNLETLKSVMGQSASLEEAISKIISLIIKIRFKTEGPRPSHLLVNDILSGAIAGRKNVFIVGMDDHKFPGGQFQDPILLDEERDKISGGLLQSKTKLKEKILDFASMLAGIGSGSNISLSYCSFDVKDERLLFPSSLLLQFYRLKELKPDADYSELLNYLKDSLEQKNASASPAAIDQGSWWLNTLLSGENLKDAKPSVFKIYPWLKQGRDALLARAGSSLTVYDGWLGPPENYPDRLKSLDPRKNEDFVLSCTGIETYAQNPYVFFISKILRIERPREIKRDNFMWLDAATRGSLLHDVYEIFLNQIKSIIINGSKSPGDLGDIALQKKMIQGILSDVVEKYKEEIPYPSLSVFKRELNDLKRDVEIFVEENQKLAVPCLLEYQFGYGGKPPVKINIGRGCFINVAGRVDRVDVSVKDDNALYVWDYKTGGTYGYDEDGYVNKGKQFQHVLYSHVIETMLKEKNPLAKVLKCGYLFPTQRGRSGGKGCIIARDPHENEKWQDALHCILDLISSGVFIVSEDENPFYIDDEDLYGNKYDKENIRQKLKNIENQVLEKYIKLKDFK